MAQTIEQFAAACHRILDIARHQQAKSLELRAALHAVGKVLMYS